MTRGQLEKVKSIVEAELEGQVDPIHGLDHIKKVHKNAISIVRDRDLELDENLLEAVCYLHDITYYYHKFGIRSWLFEKRYAKQYLDKLLVQVELADKDREIINEAVLNHPHSFPFRRLNKEKSIYTQVLQDADTLELTNNTRLRYIKKRYWLFLPVILLGVYLLRRKLWLFLNLPAGQEEQE